MEMIGDRIKGIREKKGYSITELADKAGVSKSYLSYIERNVQRNPSLRFLSKIAETLETSIEYLLEEEDPEKQNEENEVLDEEWANILRMAIDEGMSKEDLREIINFLRYKKSIHE